MSGTAGGSGSGSGSGSGHSVAYRSGNLTLSELLDRRTAEVITAKSRMKQEFNFMHLVMYALCFVTAIMAKEPIVNGAKNTKVADWIKLGGVMFSMLALHMNLFQSVKQKFAARYNGFDRSHALRESHFLLSDGAEKHAKRIATRAVPKSQLINAFAAVVAGISFDEGNMVTFSACAVISVLISLFTLYKYSSDAADATYSEQQQRYQVLKEQGFVRSYTPPGVAITVGWQQGELHEPSALTADDK